MTDEDNGRRNGLAEQEKSDPITSSATPLAGVDDRATEIAVHRRLANS